MNSIVAARLQTEYKIFFYWFHVVACRFVWHTHTAARSITHQCSYEVPAAVVVLITMSIFVFCCLHRLSSPSPPSCRRRCDEQILACVLMLFQLDFVCRDWTRDGADRDNTIFDLFPSWRFLLTVVFSPSGLFVCFLHLLEKRFYWANDKGTENDNLAAWELQWVDG